MADDPELLRLYVEGGSQVAFSEIVTRRIGLVYSIALRQTAGDAHLAEDIAQEVFAALARNASRLMSRETIVGWLYRATHFAAVDAVRKEQRRRAREMKAHSVLEAEPALPLTERDWEQARPLLDAAIARLKESDRDAILLRFYQDKSLAEIGDALRLSEDAVRMRINRALEKLRHALNGTRVTSSTAALSAIIASQESVAAPAHLGSLVTSAALSTPQAAASLPLFLKIMSTAKTSSFAAAIAGAAVLVTGSVEFMSWRRTDAEIGRQLQANHTKLSELQALERASRQAEAAVQDLENQIAAYKMPAVAPAASAEAANKLAEEERGRAYLAVHPEVKTAFINFFVSRFDGMNASLFRKLGLTTDQIKSFERIYLSHHNEVEIGIGNANNPALISLAEQSPGTVDNDLRALLGPSGFAAYQDYQATISRQGMVQDTSVSAFAAGTPLSSDQATQLQQIIVASTPESPGGFSLAQTDWAAVISKSAGVLSPAQLGVLQQQITSLKDDAVVQREEAAIHQQNHE